MVVLCCMRIKSRNAFLTARGTIVQYFEHLSKFIDSFLNAYDELNVSKTKSDFTIVIFKIFV